VPGGYLRKVSVRKNHKEGIIEEKLNMFCLLVVSC
jgi:hypothetical protein